MVPLDYQLKNSETVEIITGKSAHPSRDWLSPQSGFLASPRHRNKVRAWFRKQEAAENKLEGRALLDREIQRLGVNTPSMPELLAELKLESAEELHEALGLGEVNTAQVAAAMQRLFARARARTSRPRRAPRTPREPELEVQGVGDLLATYARCCKPVPPRADRGLHHRRTGRHESIRNRA